MNLNNTTTKKLFVLVSSLFLFSCSDSSLYNENIAREKLDKYITTKLERPETYTCTTLSPFDTVTIMGKKERMGYIEYVYKDRLDNMITRQQFVYMDTLGNVLHLDNR